MNLIKLFVQFLRKNINLSKVMHRQKVNFLRVLYLVAFQAFFLISYSHSDHLTAKVTGFVDATSPIHILGYDRKYYFDENTDWSKIYNKTLAEKAKKSKKELYDDVIGAIWEAHDEEDLLDKAWGLEPKSRLS